MKSVKMTLLLQGFNPYFVGDEYRRTGSTNLWYRVNGFNPYFVGDEYRR